MLLSTLTAATLALIPDFQSRLEKCKPRREVLVRSAPEYARRAQRLTGREGGVSLAIALDPNGAVVGLEILESEPDGFFDRSAIESVSNWQFESGTGTCWQDYEIGFLLER